MFQGHNSKEYRLIQYLDEMHASGRIEGAVKSVKDVEKRIKEVERECVERVNDLRNEINSNGDKIKEEISFKINDGLQMEIR